ncbi:hypothetical protein DB30_00040 [Enhygromyxa salina]|uniref:Uncharacterized protein n=1 Tax=Enhygromyxa salina TaxID=215803 RepID=A0A0C2D8X9_9BACT|nr:hypothetical protein [Enhygromyxa salina]KIG19531.1 hypothetical protein DB30_00040 [Enhygromyxa salina]
MTRSWLIALGCVIGCQRSEPATPPTPPQVSSPATASSPTPQPRPTGVTPDTSDSSDSSDWEPAPARGGSPCERSCGELHDCVIEAGVHGPRAAVWIELECLAACVTSPPPSAASPSLFGCALPAASRADAARCDPFLACVRDAWPDQAASAGPTSSVVVPVAKGCDRACWAFARCQGRERE